jgi:MoaA/NifB/PqqE/SkfB family radical SAM enzyme
MTDKNNCVARNELFGKTVYDFDSNNYFFMSNEEFSEFSKEHDVESLDNELIYDDNQILFAPIRSYFDITLGCNLRCKTCLNCSGKPLDGELSVEDSIKVVEGIKKDSIFEVKFSGGEPTQKKDWDKIIQSAKELGLAFSLNTNGIYAPQTLDKIIQINPDEISVSLDGSRRVNDYIRGKGQYDRALTSIREMTSAGCNVTINSVVTTEMTETDIRDMLDETSDHVSDISFFYARPIGRAKNSGLVFTNIGSANEVMQMIAKVKEEYKSTVVKTNSQNTKNNAIGSQYSKSFGLLKGGSDGFTRINVMPDGNIFAGGCALYVNPETRDEISLGNIVDENFSLLNIWHSSPLLSSIRKQSSGYKERCESCDRYKSDCSGFNLEMERFREYNNENPFCKY